ncbi:MAG: hypothetical protein L7T80_05580, partial [Arenicellales bacterium]|nr:hypothetical protein [Arenicellales bacterium]
QIVLAAQGQSVATPLEGFYSLLFSELSVSVADINVTQKEQTCISRLLHPHVPRQAINRYQ